jgi:hypothetical protein
MKSCQKYFSTCLLATAALLGGASPAWAQTAPSLGTAGDFVVLSGPPAPGGAVTTTGSTITGNVGSSGAVTLTDSTITGNVVLTGALTNVGSTISGNTITPLPAMVVPDFNSAYDALTQTCTQDIAQAAFTDAALSVNSGVICFPAAVTFTRSVLTLTGNGPWIFRTGTGPTLTGGLTGTNFKVVMANGGNACNVYWQVAAAATMTTSVFQGNILAGAGITTTGGTFAGRALAKAGVTMTGTTVVGCNALPPGLGVVCKADERLVCKHKKHKKHRHDGDRDDDDDDDYKKRGSVYHFPWSKDWRDGKSDRRGGDR